MAVQLAALLASLPAPPLTARLARCVALSDFSGGDPPRYLFTSRRRNRCNPDGVEGVYFSADESTASLEYARYWAPFGSQYQPKLTFFADLTVGHALDLGDPEVRRKLEVSDDDLFGAWRRRPGATTLQRLGAAIAAQTRIAAVLFPSAAARDAGGTGNNVVVYRSALLAPGSLVVLGPSGTVLERWP